LGEIASEAPAEEVGEKQKNHQQKRVVDVSFEDRLPVRREAVQAKRVCGNGWSVLTLIVNVNRATRQPVDANEEDVV
jgi:hypothetical protein